MTALPIQKELQPVPYKEATSSKKEVGFVPHNSNTLPADRISELFTVTGKKLPIVETVKYTSRVEWLQGKPAWISDYASHYETSRHFIARSLNSSSDYFTQQVHEGDRFNVFRKDKKVTFHLVVSVKDCRMLFYYYDGETHERFLLKSYPVGLGRPAEGMSSGCLTPLGSYDLGDRIAIYKPSDKGIYLKKETEMIRIFGTRWLPFEKGYGIHGVPWYSSDPKGALVENRNTVGRFESDGCIHLLTEDIEELFAIVITKPTKIHIVKTFSDAKLPGKESLS